MCTQQGEEDMVDEEGLDAALILAEKMQGRVKDALINILLSKDTSVSAALEVGFRKIIEDEFRYQEEKITGRILRLANPSR